MSIYNWSASLKTHRQCVGDTSRTNSYAEAISEVVKTGDVVVDVGSGTGILGIMACRAGAKRVYVIEPDQIIESARQICAANGLADEVIFLRGLSYDVAVPERADVLIAGHLHNFGLETGLLSSIIDAEKRFLKRGAAIIPQTLELRIVPVELLDTYEESIEFWRSAPAGVDYTSLRELAVENCYMADLDPSSFLSEPASLVKLCLNELKGTFVSGRVTFVIRRKGTLHGIGGWCSAALSRNVTLSNNPESPTAHWSQIFFPIAEPVAVDSGDRVACSIDTNDGNVWRWQLEVCRKSADENSATAPVKFDHSTFRPGLISKEILRKKSPGFQPDLSRRGQALLHALTLCKAQKSLAEIENEIAALYGDCFASRQVLSKFIEEELPRWVQ